MKTNRRTIKIKRGIIAMLSRKRKPTYRLKRVDIKRIPLTRIGSQRIPAGPGLKFNEFIDKHMIVG